jgi:hypothetical protein
MIITGSVLNVEFQWTIHKALIKPVISMEPKLPLLHRPSPTSLIISQIKNQQELSIVYHNVCLLYSW